MYSITEPRDFGDDFTTEHAQRMLDFYCGILTELGYSVRDCRLEAPG